MAMMHLGGLYRASIHGIGINRIIGGIVAGSGPYYIGGAIGIERRKEVWPGIAGILIL